MSHRLNQAAEIDAISYHRGLIEPTSSQTNKRLGGIVQHVIQAW